jgi:hypothetical protein
VALGEWPAAADQVEVQVTWNDLPAERIPVPLDWEQQFSARAVSEDMQLVRREQEPLEIDGVRHTAVLLTFALTGSTAAIEDWGVTAPLPLVEARHAYDPIHGLLSVRLVVFPNENLSEVTLLRTTSPPSARLLRVLAPVAEERINP